MEKSRNRTRITKTMKQKYWFMCYYWYNVFTFGIYDFFGDDIRAVEYCGSMTLDEYAKFEKAIDESTP